MSQFESKRTFICFMLCGRILLQFVLQMHIRSITFRESHARLSLIGFQIDQHFHFLLVDMKYVVGWNILAVSAGIQQRRQDRGRGSECARVGKSDIGIGSGELGEDGFVEYLPGGSVDFDGYDGSAPVRWCGVCRWP